MYLLVSLPQPKEASVMGLGPWREGEVGMGQGRAGPWEDWSREGVEPAASIGHPGVNSATLMPPTTAIHQPTRKSAPIPSLSRNNFKLIRVGGLGFPGSVTKI